MLNIVQKLFLNEADLAENHVIQSWLNKWLNMPIQIIILAIQNCIFDHEVSLSDCWNTILH